MIAQTKEDKIRQGLQAKEMLEVLDHLREKYKESLWDSVVTGCSDIEYKMLISRCRGICLLETELRNMVIDGECASNE